VPSYTIVRDLIKSLTLCDKEAAYRAMTATNFGNMNHEMLIDLLLSRVRSIHMLRHKMILLSEVEKNFGEEEAKFLNEIAVDKLNTLNSSRIVKLLDAAQLVKRSSVKSLPLELVILEVIGE